MRETEYTFAVARVRSNENKLLSYNELMSAVTASDYDEAVARLNGKGYEISGSNYAPALRQRLCDMWELIGSVLPDKSQFDSILIKNDFANLKLILKALVCQKSTEGLLVSPSVYSAVELEKAVRARENSHLPEILQHADRSAYRILTKTGFPQLADSVIDRAALEAAIKLAAAADNPIMSEIAEFEAAAADIKILYRCILTSKAKSFMERCVCECAAFSKKELIASALGSMDAFLEFLSHSDYAGAAEALKESPAAFEKYCDDRLIRILKKAKTQIFGIAPLAAYYYAVNTEVKNVRIILSAKQNALSEDAIRKRVRELYV